MFLFYSTLKRNGLIPKLKDRFNKNEGGNVDRKRDDSRFVQSSGIFSDGVGGDVRRSNKWSDKRKDKENEGGSSSLSIPALKKKNWEV